MTGQSQHVVPNGGRWSVRRTGAARASRVFDTQREAIAHARNIARNEGSELYIHGSDGRIREWDSYSGDPRPSHG